MTLVVRVRQDHVRKLDELVARERLTLAASRGSLVRHWIEHAYDRTGEVP